MDTTTSTSASVGRITILEEKIRTSAIPADLREKVLQIVQQLQLSSTSEATMVNWDQAEKYINLVVRLPWSTITTDNLDLVRTKALFDKNHYGMNQIKERIIEYLAVLKLQKQQNTPSSVRSPRAPILCFVGLVGTGKTTLAYSIAEAMGRKFIRIPFGGMGSPLDLRGQSRVHPDAEPGQVIKALVRAQSRNPVVLLDEVDRVAETARADIMGVLVELLDPEQNFAFTDHYLDYPFDLSQVLFVATANNTRHIATAVLDRLEPIQMPSYTDEEKIVIGRDYVFPKEINNCGLTVQQLTIDESIWPTIVRPLGFDAGIRTLERTINGICRKVAKAIVEGKLQSIVLTSQNIKEYLPQYQSSV
ncbi:AAA family ATPase [Candidatus Roizmanbacteria bacterium]|nr:AAA family ATPase [Candidatus Roizmanbacteria bacterium]